jgi:hypothetical protein
LAQGQARASTGPESDTRNHHAAVLDVRRASLGTCPPGTAAAISAAGDPPAISVLFVSGLAAPDFLAELETVAVLPGEP